MAGETINPYTLLKAFEEFPHSKPVIETFLTYADLDTYQNKIEH